MANVAIWSSESLWNDGVTTKETRTSSGPATMQHPATILRKWCESENLMETSLSIPLLGVAPASTPLCDARYKVCTRAGGDPAVFYTPRVSASERTTAS